MQLTAADKHSLTIKNNWSL